MILCHLKKMKQVILILGLLIIMCKINTQDSTIYLTRFWVDAPVITAGVGLTALGVSIIGKKRDFTTDQLTTISKNDLPFLTEVMQVITMKMQTS